MIKPSAMLCLVIGCAVLVSTGCGSAGRMPDGVPAGAVWVGQGRGFEYKVPADGRMYRVYRGKVDGIRMAVRKGEQYHAIGPVEGDDPNKNFDEYQYYFEAVELTPVEPGK